MTHEKIVEPTPSGGDYSEIYYFNKLGGLTDKENAVRVVIRECMNDGTLVNEIFAEA